MTSRAFDKHFDQLTRRLNDRLAHEQAWIEEQNSAKITGRQAVAAAEIAVAWQAIADVLDRGRAVPKELITALREALWQRELLGKQQKSPVKKKTPAQLDREIAAALAAGPPVKISVHEVPDDDDDDDDDDEGADDEPRYVIHDNGGEFDTSEGTRVPDVQGDIDERRLHYRTLGRAVVLDAPAGRGWY